MEMLKIIVLGIVQGITEFLPISSSGHLAVLQALFGFENAEENLFVSVILHAGSLLAILLYYARDILEILRNRRWRLVGLVVAGTVPLGIFGILLKKIIEDSEGNLWLVTACFVVTYVMLVFVHLPENEDLTLAEWTWKSAILVGLAQCVAILPGVSRSGSTISVATRLGLSKDEAARFSFFLGIPAIGAATLVMFKDIAEKTSEQGFSLGVSIPELVVGFFVSFVVGYAALAGLIAILKRGKLAWFGYYCLGLAFVLATRLLVFSS